MGTLSLVKNPQKQSLDNSGTKHVATMVKLDSIATADPFKTLFEINPAVLDKIVEDIMENGFDASQPLHIWKEKGILIDGHTRLEAAKRVDLFQVPVYEHPFDSEASALEYAIHTQRDRRNLSDAELYACILELDKHDTHGGKRVKFGDQNLPSPDSKAKTAAIIGTSKDKVQKVRTISNRASADLKDDLKKGKVSINQAYNKAKQARKLKPSSPLPSASAVSSPAPSIPLPSFSIADELAANNRIVIAFSSSLAVATSALMLSSLELAIRKVIAPLLQATPPLDGVSAGNHS